MNHLREALAKAMFERMMQNMKKAFPAIPEIEALITDDGWDTCGEETCERWRSVADAALDIFSRRGKNDL